jgi:hypothetical protein
MVAHIVLEFEMNVASKLPYLFKAEILFAEYLGCEVVILARINCDAF